MRPVSARFLRTVRGSHAMAARARICARGLTGTDPAGVAVAIQAGTVTLDGAADVRSTADLTIAAAWPRSSTDPVTPYGNELFIERGVTYGDGSTEFVSLGYFRIEDPTQDDPPDGPIRLSGKDRMSGLQDARLLAPRTYQPAATYGTVVADLVQDVFPGVAIHWDDATDLVTLGRPLTVERDRYAFLADLVRARGKIFYWDHVGELQIRTAPDSTVPVYDVTHGENGVLVTLSRKLTRAGVYNAVAASGEAPGDAAPARGVAVDNDPASPTYYFGNFGPVPRFYASPFLTTDAQAAAAAMAMLLRSRGLPYAVTFGMVPNPALEPYDPIRVRYPRSGTEIHVADRLTIPLTAAGVMTGATRELTIGDVSELS